jgi:hypothetical protein
MIRLLPSNRIGRLRLIGLVFLFVFLVIYYHTQCSWLINRAPVLYYYLTYAPREGDIIFQSLPHEESVDVIEGITHSLYSHCGAVLRNDKKQWVVIESIYNVHETPLLLWILRGRGGNFTAYRMNEKYLSIIPGFKKNLLSYIGRFYDFDYDMSRGREVYCSDLIYLAFYTASGEKLGKLEKLGDLDWKPYEHFIRFEEGGLLPLDRLLITPASLARAPQLHKVYNTYL